MNNTPVFEELLKRIPNNTGDEIPHQVIENTGKSIFDFFKLIEIGVTPDILAATLTEENKSNTVYTVEDIASYLKLYHDSLNSEILKDYVKNRLAMDLIDDRNIDSL